MDAVAASCGYTDGAKLRVEPVIDTSFVVVDVHEK